MRVMRSSSAPHAPMESARQEFCAVGKTLGANPALRTVTAFLLFVTARVASRSQSRGQTLRRLQRQPTPNNSISGASAGDMGWLRRSPARAIQRSSRAVTNPSRRRCA